MIQIGSPDIYLFTFAAVGASFRIQLERARSGFRAVIPDDFRFEFLPRQILIEKNVKMSD